MLRALAGFMVHPNVGAILALDLGVEPITNARLEAYMREHGLPLDHVRHAFLSVGGGLAAGLAAGEKIVRGWIDAVEADVRTEEPLAGLRIALQCGGSDAFSGVSGNPLAGAIVHELIRHGGTGVLCETDETAGAEAYVLRNTRDIEIARGVLRHIQSFKERLSWHGVTPESNPSGGNKLRGLYNITLKSLGAVHKKDPRTPVDHVIDYADPLTAPGFYFMNSPGNDLEGIAGQVASGCNLVLFVTGNGSITNFPFVPTLKITTTTQRHLLLKHEMDINAGRYLDGEAMPALVDEAFDLTIATASGERTQGEKAGHSQAQLWRNWRQTERGADRGDRGAARAGRAAAAGRGDRRVRRVGAGAHRHGAHRPGPADEHVLVADRAARGRAPQRLQRRPAPRHRSLRRAGALRGLRLRRRIDLRHAAADLPRLRHPSQRRGGAAPRARLREGAERRDAARLRARRPAARSLRLGERPARWRHRSRDRARAAVVRDPAARSRPPGATSGSAR